MAVGIRMMAALLTMAGAVPATWAVHSGITPDAALAELRAQAETGPVTDALVREFADRFAGIIIDQRPYRVTVHLTGPDPVPGRSVVAGGMTVFSDTSDAEIVRHRTTEPFDG